MKAETVKIPYSHLLVNVYHKIKEQLGLKRTFGDYLVQVPCQGTTGTILWTPTLEIFKCTAEIPSLFSPD